MKGIFGNIFIVLSEKALETEKNAFYRLSISFLVPEKKGFKVVRIKGKDAKRRQLI